MPLRRPLNRVVSLFRQRPSMESAEGAELPRLEAIDVSGESAEAGASIALPPRDRIVDQLQREQLLCEEQRAEAIRIWASFPEDAREPLWRVVARMDGVDRDVVYEMAASTYGFSPLKVSMIGTLARMDQLGGEWPDSAWPRLAGLGGVPVVLEGASGAELDRLTVGSFDPVRPELRGVVSEMTQGAFRIGFLAREHVDAIYLEAARVLPHLISSSIRRLESPGVGVLTRAA